MKPCVKEDFFKDGKVICYADWYLTAVSRLLRFFKPKKNGHKPISFKESMTNALTMTGGGHRFLMLSHCPRTLKRSAFEDKQDCRFCCFNSLDQATSEDREMIISWIRSHLGITE